MDTKPTYEELEKRIQELEKIDSEQKLVKGKLYEEMRFSQTLLQAAPVFFVAINAEGKTIMINETMLHSLGYRQEEVFGKDYMKTFVPKRDRERLSEIFEKLINYKKPTLNENYIMAKDGKEFLIEWHGRSVFNNKGEFSYFFGLGIDITERRLMEEALRESERKYKSLTNNLSVGIFRNTKEPEGRFLEANPAIVKMFGFNSREEFLTLKVTDTYKNPHDRERYTQKLIQEGEVKNEELVLRKKDGSIFTGSVSAVVVKTEDNEVKYYDGFIEDITERQQAEKILLENEKQLQMTNDLLLKNLSEIKKTKEDLKNSEEKYRTLFESANDAIFLMDHERFMDCNNRTLEMFNCSKAEIIGQPPYRYSPEKQPDGRDSKSAALEKINAALNIGPQVFEWTHSRFDGSLFDAEVSLTVLYFMGKRHLLAIVRDISQRKNAEKENLGLQKRLNQAQKMEAIGTLAGGIAHDFNNILSGIFGYSQLAETHIHNPEKAKGHIRQVIKGAQRAAELIHQILTFSRQKETEKHPFRAYLEVKEALKLLRASIPSTIEIKENIDSRSIILANPSKIHQVVMNLCTNAFHAMMDRGGILKVSLKDVDASELNHIRDKKPARGKYLQLAVSDTGHGMDDKTIEKAFDPYFTTKKMEEGTGLGLAIVKAVVEEHDGFLEVTSIPDQGTHFYIYFPLAGQETTPGQIENDMASGFEGNETILMVDDEADIRLSYKKILEGYGYRVHIFQNGIDAFKAFEKKPYEFDLILTDLTMPGMTGLELIQKIHGVRQDIPSILCSGFCGLINHEKSIQTGVSKYLMKPVLKRDLVLAIRELMGKKQGPSTQTQGV